MPLSRTPAVALAAAVVCVAAFTAGRDLPRLAHASGGATAELRGEVLRQLEAHYYRRIDPHVLDGRSLRELPRTLADPYTLVLSRAAVERRDQNEGGHYAGIGVQLGQARDGVRFLTVRRGSPAARAGLRPGDVLSRIDGRRAGTQSVIAAGARLRGRTGSTVTIEILRGDARSTLRLRRAELPLTLVRSRLVAGTGVISVSEFATGAGAKVRAATHRLIARGARRVVLDLRGNPGGYVKEAVALAGVFLPRGSVMARESGLHVRPFVLRTRARPVASRLPLAVLVDGESASAAEIVSGALRDHGRAVLVGARTFGKGVIQDVLPLPAGQELKLTIAEYRTPAGTVIHHRGLMPDVFAFNDPGTARDEVLARAVATLERRAAGGRR